MRRTTSIVVLCVILWGALIVIHPFAPAHHTLTLVQTKLNNACALGTTCAVTVTATTAGSLLVGYVYPGSSATAAVGVSGAGTWVHSTSPSCNGNNGTFGVDSVYILSATGGATSITLAISASSPANWHAMVREYTFTGSSVSFDTCAGAVNASCTSCAGVTLTLGGSTDVVVQAINPGATCSAITTYTDIDTDGAGGVCSANLKNTSSGTAPTWTTAAGVSMVSATAIRENSACSASRLLIGAGC